MADYKHPRNRSELTAHAKHLHNRMESHRKQVKQTAGQAKADQDKQAEQGVNQ